MSHSYCGERIQRLLRGVSEIFCLRVLIPQPYTYSFPVLTKNTIDWLLWRAPDIFGGISMRIGTHSSRFIAAYGYVYRTEDLSCRCHAFIVKRWQIHNLGLTPRPYLFRCSASRYEQFVGLDPPALLLGMQLARHNKNTAFDKSVEQGLECREPVRDQYFHPVGQKATLNVIDLVAVFRYSRKS